MRLSQKAGKIFSETRCRIPAVQTYRKLFKVLTILLMLTLLTKLCPTTVELSLISNRKLTYLLTTMPGLANSTCHNPIVKSTNSSRKCLQAPSVDNESCVPLLMSKPQSTIKRMKGNGADRPDNIPPSFLKSLGPLVLQELLSIFN